jgi:predicted nucleotidyltransferase
MSLDEFWTTVSLYLTDAFCIFIIVPSYVMLKITGYLDRADKWVDKKRKN